MKHLLAIVVAVAAASFQIDVAESATTLDRIKDKREIRIGFRQSEPPMSFLDKDGQPVGYSIDLCLRIVNEVKRKLASPDIAVKYVAVTGENRFQALTDNAIDILCGATTKTLSRAELVDFTQLTFVTGASLISLRSAQVQGIGDLQGKKVAVVKGTTTIDAVDTALKDSLTDAQIVPVESASVGMKALMDGKVHAFSSDQVVLIGLVLGLGEREKFAVSEELFSFEPFALAVRRGDSEFRLLADRVLSQLYRTGQVGSIYKKWFGPFSQKVPPMVEALYILNATPE